VPEEGLASGFFRAVPLLGAVDVEALPFFEGDDIEEPGAPPEGARESFTGFKRCFVAEDAALALPGALPAAVCGGCAAGLVGFSL
jgi:hypothetical protein